MPLKPSCRNTHPDRPDSTHALHGEGIQFEPVPVNGNTESELRNPMADSKTKLSGTPAAESGRDAVAIIGMDCLFPRSPGLAAYWRLIRNGLDAIAAVPPSHWSVDDYFSEKPDEKDHVYCRRGGFLPAVDFDPAEFGIPPASLEATDTSQLLGLMVAKKALEDAGYGPRTTFARQRTSVILGVTGTQELVIPLGARLGFPKWRRALEEAGIASEKAAEVVKRISESYVAWQENSFPGLLGNVVAGRISNRLDLGGTNCVVDAACASSLGALHLAILELQGNRCDMAVTGGVDTLNDIFMHMCFCSTGVLSPTEEVRPFSRHADGTLLGEGVGLLVLKRLADAERDDDRIYAVIRAIGTSSDGRSQSIYAPRIEGQVQALENAYDQANINPGSIELIEAHGTGTRVGDRVEVQALKAVFQNANPSPARRVRRCALGSVKSMIGHTKAAAGSAGLIKTALCLHYKALPATIKAEEPDPELDLEKSPFYLNTRTRPWFSQPDHPRRAGVSAFGFGGSNFHAVLEEYGADKKVTAWDGSVEIVALGGDSAAAVADQVDDWRAFLRENHAEMRIRRKAADARRTFAHSAVFRLLLVLEQPAEQPGAAAALFEKAARKLADSKDGPNWSLQNIFFGGPAKPGKLCYVFPGQGSQYVDMGRELAVTFPEALALFERANKACDLPRRLSDYVFPLPSADKDVMQQQEAQLRSTDIAQPAIGAVSLMMLKILERFGLSPDAACGHSYGELCAHLAAGWIDLDTLFYLSVMRGRFMAAAGKDGREAGTMLAVKAPLGELQALIDESGTDVILANRNSPTQGVLSGNTAAIAEAAELCQRHGFRTVPLPVAAAFHSRLVKSAQQPFAQVLEDVRLTPSKIPVFSNTTATAYPRDPEQAKQILARQILRPVDFVNEIENLFSDGVRTFVEIGPKAVLTSLVKAILKGKAANTLCVDASGGRKSGLADLARCLAHLAALGYGVQIDRWGGTTPPSDPKKPVMNIPICGANYRKPGPAAAATPTNPPPQTKPRQAQDVRHAGTAPAVPSGTARGPNPADRQAIDAVKQGLEAILQLQQQTAQAHQLFLETQHQAALTLQRLLDQSRRLSGIEQSPADAPVPLPSIPLPGVAADSPSAASAGPAHVPDRPGMPETAAHGIDPLAVNTAAAPVAETRIQPTDTFRPQKPAAPQDHATASSAKAPEPVAATLMQVVADLTGYPVEMLKPTMDIEADLGIDSIKRVEILSAFEEKMPGLGAIAPEKLASLKTLEQIITYLQSDAAAPAAKTPGPRSAAAEAPSSPPAPDDRSRTEAVLMQVVADLTGYPVEMLKPAMDIEADLGIDSIKRVEILSAFEEKMPGLGAIAPEKVATLRTLGQIIDVLAALDATDDAPPAIRGKVKAPAPHVDGNLIPLPHAPRSLSGHGPEPLPKTWPEAIDRRRVVARETPFNAGARLALSGDSEIFIVGQSQELASALAAEFSRQGLTSHALSLTGLLKAQTDIGKAGGLIILAPEKTPPSDDFMAKAFAVSRRLAPALLSAARTGGAFFATLARMDGRFGTTGQGDWSPLQGGLAGLLKTAAHEWPNVLCRALDLSANWRDFSAMAHTVVSELLTPDRQAMPEVGYFLKSSNLHRVTLALEDHPFRAADGDAIALAEGDLVVVSGGARGIAAAAARALAEQSRPHLVLLGRSAAPFSEPAWLRPAADAAAMKRLIFKHDFSTGQANPAALEKAYLRYQANREIHATLDALRRTGCRADYYAVDIRHAARVKKLLAETCRAHGPLRAIIHAAGVLKDRFIIDKTEAQFRQVFDTKVAGLESLLEAAEPARLRYLVLFSSVAARMGNAGQADYAAANEVLNKMAQRQARRRTGCRVISINWGPWDGGMVSETLKKAFTQRNIALIPEAQGVRCLLLEMLKPPGEPCEVVIGAGLTPPAAQGRFETGPAAAPGLSLTFKREIDMQNHPVLNSHVLDGKPVVPFALMAEWCGHGALHANPGLQFCGLEDMRLLKGIRIDAHAKVIRLMAGKPEKRNRAFAVDVEIRDGVSQGSEVVHTRARTLLAENYPPPPAFDLPRLTTSEDYPRGMHEVYDQILFHGRQLQGIRRIVSSTQEAMVAELAAAPPPAQWIREPMRNHWLIDPLVLDSAFQMASLWCYDHLGMVSLPSFSRSYQQYRRRFPQEGVTAVFELRASSDSRIRADFTFLDAAGTVVARIKGYEAVMSDTLFKAFRANSAA